MKANICFMAALFAAYAVPANAIEFETGRASLRISGYGTAGMIEPDFDKPDFIGDFRARAQFDYRVTNAYSFGAVYSIDAAALDEDRPLREAFGFFDARGVARMEVGVMDSIARKLGLGLPDVGGLRVNDKPLFYKKIHADGSVIADTILTTGRRALRLNLASAQMGAMQGGVSFAGGTDDFDYAVDMGLKIKSSAGKTKTAFSFAASFMERPDNYRTDNYTSRITADWRAQASVGMNLQYNSWVWGLNGRAIYDKKPVGRAADGLALGTGVSYDILNYSVSLSYIFSDTGIWHKDAPDYTDHTVVASFRYKYSENVDGWMSIGMTTETPFVAAGMRIAF